MPKPRPYVKADAVRKPVPPANYPTGRFRTQQAPDIKKVSASQQPFSKWNFFMIGCCGLLIIIGFLLMLGGGSSAENGFNPDIFSTRRIVVGPSLAFPGFLLMAFAIFIDPTKLKSRRTRKTKKTE